MSKNIEILVELLSDECFRFEKLIAEQAQITNNLASEIKNANAIVIDTARLEEVIQHWNRLFTEQKKQIVELTKNQYDKNNKHRIVTYLMLVLVILTLIINNIIICL